MDAEEGAVSQRQDKARAALAVVRERGVCAHCGTSFAARAKSVYCSKECVANARRTLISVTCSCGVVFQRRPTDMRRAERSFCSKHCATVLSYQKQMVGGYEVRGKDAKSLARNVYIVEMALSGSTRAQIAAHLQISMNIVVSTLVRSGVRGGAAPVIIPWHADEDEIIIRNQDTTAAALAEMLPGRSPKAVQARRDTLGRKGVIPKRTRPIRGAHTLKRTTRAPSHIVGAFSPTTPKPPTTTHETIVPTSYNLPDPKRQCCYLYGQRFRFLQCQAEATKRGWCEGHYKAVYRVAEYVDEVAA